MNQGEYERWCDDKVEIERLRKAIERMEKAGDDMAAALAHATTPHNPDGCSACEAIIESPAAWRKAKKGEGGG